jgi:hypothetical protein
MLSGLSTKLIIAGVVLAVLGGVGLYIKSIIDENAILLGNQRQLETALDLKDTEISSMQDQAVTRRELATVARQAMWDSQAKVDELEAKLARHDLSYLVKRKPGLMTKVFQKGTAEVHNEIEEAANAVLD